MKGEGWVLRRQRGAEVVCRDEKNCMEGELYEEGNCMKKGIV